MRLAFGLLPLAGALALAGCGGDAHKTSTTAPESGARDAAGCLIVPRPKPRSVTRTAPPRGRLDPARTWTATVVTTCGTFTIELDVKQAPRTTASFSSLAGRRFYDGLSFHRVLPGFLIQGGDPRGDGFGGPGYQTVERPPVDVEYVRGTVAMGRTPTAPAGEAGSQFFIVTAENAAQSANLTPDYALVGHVVAHMEVVDRIGSEPTSGEDRPVHAVVIRSVRVSAR